MQFIKYCMLFSVFILSCIIGKCISQKYTDRLNELEELLNCLNIFKTKIKFTYDPITEIFENISNNSTNSNIAKLFLNAKNQMDNHSASESWMFAVENYKGNLKEEDKNVIKTLSKLLGTTDAEGQISQIEVTIEFLKKQVKDAMEEKDKNGKLYKKLGYTIGLAIVIILV